MNRASRSFAARAHERVAPRGFRLVAAAPRVSDGIHRVPFQPSDSVIPASDHAAGMGTVTVPDRVPRLAVGVVAALLLVTLAYSVLVTQQLLAWVVLWGAVAAVGLAAVALFLLYRLVVAVEAIADAL